MKEVREYRDPFISDKEYRQKIWGSSLFKIFTIVLILAILLLSYFLHQKDVERTAELKMFGNMKCLSTCPLEPREDFEGSQNTIRFFTKSCYVYCSSIYKESLSKQEREVLASNKTRINISAFNLCYNGLLNPQFDYQSCFTDFFSSHSFIKEFTNYYPPIYYTLYEDSAKIECENNFARVFFKYEKGYLNLTVYSSLKMKDGSRTYQIKLGTMKEGQSKNFTLNYPTDKVKEEIDGVHISSILQNNVTLSYKFYRC